MGDISPFGLSKTEFSDIYLMKSLFVSKHGIFGRYNGINPIIFILMLAALAQMVASLPLVQQVRGSIPGGVVNFNLKIFNLGARRGGDVHFLIARLYSTVLD